MALKFRLYEITQLFINYGLNLLPNAETQNMLWNLVVMKWQLTHPEIPDYIHFTNNNDRYLFRYLLLYMDRSLFVNHAFIHSWWELGLVFETIFVIEDWKMTSVSGYLSCFTTITDLFLYRKFVLSRVLNDGSVIFLKLILAPSRLFNKRAAVFSAVCIPFAFRGIGIERTRNLHGTLTQHRQALKYDQIRSENTLLMCT